MAFDIAPYGAAIASTSDLLNGILKRVLPEKVSEETALKLNQELTLALLNNELQPMLAQLAVDANEAKSESMFVAGWRPAIGWICGSALAWTFVVAPFAVFWLQTFGVHTAPLPVLDSTSLMPILLGMLGLGGLRTFEKVQSAGSAKVGK